MKADPGTVNNGNLGEVKVDHENQGAYTLFSANDDAICVAWVTTTWSDDRGGNKYAVSGDYGEACGGTWFESHMYTDSNKEHQPKCFWIDKNGDQAKTVFQVRWPAFSESEYDSNSDKDPKRLCNNIDFGFRDEKDPNSINYWTSSKKRSSPLRVRQPIARPECVKSELVVSEFDNHSAKRLCESHTSMGPDFAHIREGLFCDTEHKILYPFCNEKITNNCFDLETRSIHHEHTGPIGHGNLTALVNTQSLVKGPNASKPMKGPSAFAANKATEDRYERVRDWRIQGK
ncbi:hypothetical protein EYZ11_011692 [Aspergillus tanneri]|uniref:Uncharacterized protein n=1 Tax=Aspergillus tanneri TaxID=1220188 RepID=A0A4S3J7H6_9EURO|nr:uncharacterized protein ATNIH1004_011453 [Aspergillus tanneri]KAA8642508.1 hypothetical protein ATNIH1004_011453 [Aspergillus tanneri]THC88861.1 hypothetical protein EYZ11_011692 [Aspergillus tanneri]